VQEVGYLLRLRAKTAPWLANE
jgi:hypothetical protein